MKLIVVFLGMLFFLSSPALAQESYGTWDGNENYSGNLPLGPAYDSELDPFSDGGNEYSNFICATNSGVTLSESDQQILADILTAASSVYNGEFYVDGIKDPFSDRKKPPENGGYPPGSAGIGQFINTEKSLLESGRWVPYQNRQIIPIANKKPGSTDTYPVPTPGWVGKTLDSAQAIPSFKGKALSSVLNEKTKHPLTASEKLPEACALGVAEVEGPVINDLFSNPGKFQSDSFLYIPTNIAVSALEFFEPYAFRWTFWTPHSERSDLIWDTPNSCAPTATNESQGYVSRNCSEKDSLSFSQSNDSSASGEAWYLKVAHFVQWLVSGTYLVILLIAIVLFMLKGNRKTQLQLTVILPRILGAILLTAFAGYLIGMMITFSNTIVQTIFNLSEAKTIGVVSAVLLESGNIIGGSPTMQDIGQLVVSALSSFYFIVFVLVSLIRQILLVMLIILFPLAAFALISPRWQSYFSTYFRALFSVIFLPVLLAFIFKISLSINPLVLDPLGSYGNLQGLLGLILLLITFWLMYRAIKISFQFVKGGGRAVVEEITPDENSRIYKILERPVSDKKGSDMVPENKMILARNTPQTASANRVAAHLPNTANRRSYQSPGEELGQAMVSKQGGSQRISTGAAKSYKEKLRAAIGAATARKGAPLSEEEVQKIKESFARKNGGKLAEKDGSYYLNPVEEEVVRSREK